VSLPSERQQLASLAALSGSHPELPEAGFQRDLLRLKLIDVARKQGVTWAQIGRVLGYGGPKATKCACKRLARRVSAELAKSGVVAAGAGSSEPG